MSTTYSAPGKIYLLGEHAAVYGYPAIICAVELRTYVTVKENSHITISSDIGTSGLDYRIHPYVSAVLESLGSPSVSIDISSDIPVGSGLGSSAAVAVATLAAIDTEFELGLNRTEIARKGHEIEMKIQGTASPADTFVSVFGGMIEMPVKQLGLLDCDVVIGNTGIRKDTKQLIMHVKKLISQYPDETYKIIKTIGSLPERGKYLINNKDYVSLGRLMNINHGLLDALGVSTMELSTLTYAARNAGAFGAKITGAGGGGCIVALTDSPQKVASEIERVGGKAIITEFTNTGIMEI